ncbi:MAG: type IV toxin-antitoxin system AbiEi family antitoxin domain-containing protein [Polyangiaceae bacterium]
MPRSAADGSVPSWDQLWEIAATQMGYFTAAQAEEAGFSRPLLQYHLKSGKLERAGRGVFRLTRFPPGDHEDLMPLWLWARGEGVFSHETALLLHELSDALPGTRHMTVPSAWSSRRVRVPKGLLLSYGDLSAEEVEWKGAIKITTPLRTVVDCTLDAVDLTLVEQAINQGVRRGAFTRALVRHNVKARRE